MPLESPEKRRQAAEAATIRRRWINLGEVIAVLAVLIWALTLWFNYKDRQDDVKQGVAKAATLIMTATIQDDGKWLAVRAVSDDQTIQSQTVEFPAKLGVDVADTAGAPRIETHWFENALKKARAAAGKPDNSRGDERLPVAITTRFLADGHLHEDRAIYDIGYAISGRVIAGHTLSLRGLSRVGGVGPAELQPRLDARWAQIMPEKD